MSADLLTRLMSAGTPMDLISEVAMALATAQADAAGLKTRRAKDAARQQEKRQRERVSRDITLPHGTSRDDADSSPLDKKSPQTPKKLNPPISPDEPDGSSPPAGAKPGAASKSEKGKGGRGTRIAPDWQPCPTSQLTERTQRMVAGWAAGAYEHVAEMFRGHWLSESRALGSKRDWQATWDNWLRRENSSVLRQMREGIRFDLPTTVVVAGRSAAELQADAAGVAAVAEAREAEGDRAARMRVILRSAMGPRLYDEWLKGVALRLEGETLVVLAPSEFARGWIEQHHTARVAEAASEVLGRAVIVAVRLVQPPG